MTFRPVYEELLSGLLSSHREHNRRTGVAIRVADPCSFTLDLSDGLLPVCGVRKTFPKTAAAEVAWFLLGTRKPAFISKHAPIWDKFIEEVPGEPIMTSAEGPLVRGPSQMLVAGAYGHRWRWHFGRDQIADAIAALVANPTDRRVFVCAWDPGQDGLGRPSKNVPCPVGFTLSITNGRLNSTLLIRSSDVFVGLPYDVMGHALLLGAIRASIDTALAGDSGLTLGSMQVSLAHPHLYEVHEGMAEMALASEPSDSTILIPDWGVKRIASLPDEYVALVASRQAEMAHPAYMCRPEVVL